MANLPRPGVVNLNFADVSRIAQDVESNDPLRLALSAGSQIVSDRDKNLLYRRALAKSQGLPEPEGSTFSDTIGKGVDTILQAPKSAYNYVSGNTQEPAATGGNETLTAPRNMSTQEAWSEMARINPQQASFDRSVQQQNQSAEMQRQKMQRDAEMDATNRALKMNEGGIDSPAMIKEMAVQFRNYAGSIGSSNWNNFNDTQKREILNGYNGLRGQLAKTDLGRALIGTTESEIMSGKTEPAQVSQTLNSDDLQSKIDAAFIQYDNPNTTTVEGLANIEKLLEDARINGGVPANDPVYTSLRSYITSTAKTRSESAGEKKGDVEKAQQRESSQFSQFKDFYPSYESVKAINEHPENQTNIQLGVSELLKILSGTGVSDRERANTILALTSDEYQNAMKTKAYSVGKSLVDMVLSMDDVALAEYSKHVKPERISSQLEKRIPPSAWKWAESQSKGRSKQGTKQEQKIIIKRRKR